MADNGHVEGTSSSTLTILGCGTLGSAILFGLLASSAEYKNRQTHHDPKKLSNGNRPSNGYSSGATEKDGDEEEQELLKPSRIIACVRTEESVQRLKKALAVSKHQLPVTVVMGDNARAVQAADTVLLGCQPQHLVSCLGAPAVRKAIRGKLLISILAGVTIPQIEEVLDETTPPPQPITESSKATLSNGNVTRSTAIIRAMPNTASFVRASTTVMTACSIAEPPAIRFVEWLFSSIGTVTRITAAQFDACTALCGSTPAFFALFLESLLDGAVALGLKRSDAHIMAAETMKGAAMLMLAGEQPHTVKEKVATPGGSTIQGILELERKALRGSIADALIKCTSAASLLGSKQA
ncbi:MAG: hypothetical protein Q9220_004837 [cf. Caloplaca sp. 1 TL-2023]